VAGAELEAFCVDAAPAQVVLHAMLKLTPRRPALVVVGINFGENLGADATISGTVGAALQGAASGIPALAVSLQTPKETHTQISDAIDFSVAAHFTRRLARMVLQATLPYDVDVLKIDIPDSATAQTEWRLTRVSRQTYFRPHRPERTAEHAPAGLDYDAGWDLEELERDSDIYALAVDRVVSVSPLSIDLTSRVELAEVARSLDAPELY
jgi:5'-nucleotidase